MRELILKMSMSLDGLVGAADGGIKWLFQNDQEATDWTVETVWNASLHIIGSRTFHDMAAYWPTSTEVYAPPMNQIPKAVFTRQGAAILNGSNTTTALKDARANAGTEPPKALQPGAESWAQTYVASGDLGEEILKLKAQDGKPIIAMAAPASPAVSSPPASSTNTLCWCTRSHSAKACRSSPASPCRGR